MKGKYINTVIMMAALSGKKKNKNNKKETLASLNNHRIIWSKQKQNSINVSHNSLMLID